MERTRRTSWKGSLLKNVASWNATDKYVDFFGDVLKRWRLISPALSQSR
jgi:hypothetical protein